MPHYLIQAAYNSGGLAALVQEPQDRIEKVKPAIEALGGRIESAYYAFGEHDIVLDLRDAGQRQGCGHGARDRRRRGCFVLHHHGPAHA